MSKTILRIEPEDLKEIRLALIARQKTWLTIANHKPKRDLPPIAAEIEKIGKILAKLGPTP